MKNKKFILISFITLTLLLILSFLVYYLSPRIKYSYDSTTDSYSIVRAYGCANSYTIPSTYKGKKVTTIKRKAFEFTKTKNIIFEENSNITTIESRAFYNTKIRSISLPDSVTYIYEDAFAYSSLEEIHTSESSNYKDIAGSTFFNCKNLKIVDIKNILSIGSFAFYNCISLESLSLGLNACVYTHAFVNDTLTLYTKPGTFLDTNFDLDANITIVEEI